MNGSLPKLPQVEFCTGCSACAASCPAHALTMCPNHEGALLPVLDESICRRCLECEQICPVLHPSAPRYKQVDSSWTTSGSRVFAVQAQDVDLRLKATSGGVVPLLSRRVIECGGSVFGVVCDLPSGRVHYSKATSLGELKKFMGAKYVQAEPEMVFQDVQKTVKCISAPVLFVGTPCQVAGLKAFLKNDPPNLFLVELICHSVPTPLAWYKYLSSLKRPANQVSFRSKKRGWKNYSMSITDMSGHELLSHWHGYSYLWGFLGNLYNRLSCHHCTFRRGRSGADITVGDFWGVAGVFPDMDDNTGTSLVITHGNKGLKFFEAIRDCVFCRESDFEKAVSNNPALIEDPPVHPERMQFLKALVDGADFDQFIRKTLNMSLLARLRRLFRRLLRLDR